MPLPPSAPPLPPERGARRRSRSRFRRLFAAHVIAVALAGLIAAVAWAGSPATAADDPALVGPDWVPAGTEGTWRVTGWDYGFTMMWGDDAVVETSTPTARHTYAEEGTYALRASREDIDAGTVVLGTATVSTIRPELSGPVDPATGTPLAAPKAAEAARFAVGIPGAHRSVEYATDAAERRTSTSDGLKELAGLTWRPIADPAGFDVTWADAGAQRLHVRITADGWTRPYVLTADVTVVAAEPGTAVGSDGGGVGGSAGTDTGAAADEAAQDAEEEEELPGVAVDTAGAASTTDPPAQEDLAEPGILARPIALVAGIVAVLGVAGAVAVSIWRPARWLIILGVCAVGAVGGGTAVVISVGGDLPALAGREPVPGPTIDFRMGERYDLSWKNYGTEGVAYPASFVSPDTWNVLIEACTFDGHVDEYTWEFALEGEWSMTTAPSAECAQWVEVPEEDVEYDVTLTWTQDGASHRKQAIVPVDDLLIVSFGDSNASGEGNIEDDRGLFGWSGGWMSEQCHRSRISGHSLAAKAQEADPHTSVTFLSFACSGASLRAGVLGPYAGIDPAAGDGRAGTVDGRLEPQVDQLLRALCGRDLDESLDGCDGADKREVDQLLLSAGVNDSGFGKVMMGCVNFDFLEDGWYMLSAELLADIFTFLSGVDLDECHEDPILTQMPVRFLEHQTSLDSYRFCGGEPCGRYDYGAVNAWVSHRGLDVEQTYLTGYPGHLFGEGTDVEMDLCHSVTLFSGVTRDEVRWINATADALEEHMAAEAARNGWVFVGGMTERFLGHSYCHLGTSYYVGLAQSLWESHNADGVLHPNADGHGQVADRIVEVIANGSTVVAEPRAEVTVEIRRARLSHTPDGMLDPGDLVAGGTPQLAPMTASVLPYRLIDGTEFWSYPRSAQASAFAEDVVFAEGEWVPIGTTLRTWLAEQDDAAQFRLDAWFLGTEYDGALRQGRQQLDEADAASLEIGELVDRLPGFGSPPVLTDAVPNRGFTVEVPITGFGPTPQLRTETHDFGDTTLELDLCIVVDEPTEGGFELAVDVQSGSRDLCSEVSVAAGG